MITLITGAPGAGKTAALVLLLQSALVASGRQVYVFGIPELKIAHEALVDPTKWPSDVPDGSIVILDEVQNVWRPRGPGQAVPDHVKALETHRHRGLDFYIITQGPNLVDSNVRSLVGRHIHLRDIGFLGRWWYEWPECADNCRVGWKNAPIKKKYKLPKAIFGEYKSASLHVKPIRSFPKMFVLAIVALIGVALLSYRAYSSVRDKLHPVVPAAVVGAPVLNASSSPAGKGGSVVKMTTSEFVASFQPRLDGLPQTAPRYDEVTAAKTAPYPAACVSMGARCDCFTQQATKLPVPRPLCLQIVKDGFFNDWQAPPSVPVVAAADRLTGGNLPDYKAAPDAVAVASVAAMDSDVRSFMQRNRKPSL